MSDATGADRPRAIGEEQLVEPEGQRTPGMRRLQAVAADDRWIGIVRTEAGAWSGWHHHGDHETYFYVMRGTIELEYGSPPRVVRVASREFGHVPARLVHRERTGPGSDGEAVLVRIGSGPPVVNVDDPPAASGPSAAPRRFAGT